MKMSLPNSVANKKRIASPPIYIEYPGIKDIPKDGLTSFKLRSHPTKVNSPTHKLLVAFFKSRTPEEYL